jgi:hypothetical protein
MEANWMKAIPSSSICNFFYFFFVLYALIAVLGLMGFVGIALSPKLLKVLTVPSSLSMIIGIVLAGTQALFFYLICSRSLLEVKQTKEGFLVLDAADPKKRAATPDGDTFADMMDCTKPENMGSPQCKK